MFLSGMNPVSAMVFSVPTLIITIPATIIALHLDRQPLRLAAADQDRIALLSRLHLHVRRPAESAAFFLAQPVHRHRCCTGRTSWSATSIW